MSFLLDTDTCSAHLKQKGPVSNRFLQYAGGLHISTITLCELYAWALRASAPTQRADGLREMVRDLKVLEVTTEVAERYGRIQAALLDVGRPAPAPPARPSAKIDVAKSNIASLQTALDAFEVDVGRYPTAAEGLQALVVRPQSVKDQDWRGPYLTKVPKDPWGNLYVYRFPGKHNQNGFDLYSFGPDGKEGGGDDVTNW